MLTVVSSQKLTVISVTRLPFLATGVTISHYLIKSYRLVKAL